MLNLEASRPYVMTPGRNRAEVGNMKRLKLTEFFLNSLKDEIKKMEGTPEYRMFLLICAMNKMGFKEGEVTHDEENHVYQLFEFGNLILYVNPYDSEVSVNSMEAIREDEEAGKRYKQFMKVFERVFQGDEQG